MRSTTSVTLLPLLALAACATAHPARRPDYAALVAAPDRLDADRALDGGRHPVETLAFTGARPGMRVADLAAGGGYTTELLALAVAPGGVVYSQNSAVLLKLAGQAWSDRLARPALANVVRVEREFEDPLPPEALRRRRTLEALRAARRLLGDVRGGKLFPLPDRRVQV